MAEHPRFRPSTAAGKISKYDAAPDALTALARKYAVTFKLQSSPAEADD